MKYLSDYMQDRQTILFEKTGSFFAFSGEQFEEQMKPKTQYVSAGLGLYCPEENYKKLKEGLDQIHETSIKEDVKENGAEGIISREYFNYESAYTGNTAEARGVLSDYKKHFPNLFTEEVINKVFKSCYKEAIENNWI